MAFKLKREILAQELSILSAATEKKGTIPILSTVLIEIKNQRARLTCSDCDLFLTTEVDADGEDWNGCVPFRELFGFVRFLDKSAEFVAFSLEDTRITAKAGKSKIKLPLYLAESFPRPEKASTQKIAIDGKWLSAALSRVIVSAADESDHLSLAGVKLECADNKLTLVATDQYRLSYTEAPLQCAAFDLFLPRLAVIAIMKLETDEIILSFNENVAHIVAGSRELVSRLLTGQFPNWRLILPKSPKYVMNGPTEQIQDAIRRASVTLDGKAREAIHLRFSKQSLTVKTAETDKGYSEDTVDVESNMNGESVIAGFNKQYLSDALSGIGDQVEISFTDALGQMKFKPLNSDEVIRIVAPCRI